MQKYTNQIKTPQKPATKTKPELWPINHKQNPMPSSTYRSLRPNPIPRWPKSHQWRSHPQPWPPICSSCCGRRLQSRSRRRLKVEERRREPRGGFTLSSPSSARITSIGRLWGCFTASRRLASLGPSPGCWAAPRRRGGITRGWTSPQHSRCLRWAGTQSLGIGNIFPFLFPPFFSGFNYSEFLVLIRMHGLLNVTRDLGYCL